VRAARPPLPPREEQWRVLLGELSAAGTVHEVGPGRIEVRELEHPDQTLRTVVVTPEEWEQVVTEQGWVDLDIYIGGVFSPRDDDETFVVFWRGELARSVREELPPVRGRALERRVAQLRAENPDAVLGWFAYPPGDDRG
jgi:hypothetical protein